MLDSSVQTLRWSCPQRPPLTPQLMKKHADFINSVMTGSLSTGEAEIPQKASKAPFKVEARRVVL